MITKGEFRVRPHNDNGDVLVVAVKTGKTTDYPVANCTVDNHGGLCDEEILGNAHLFAAAPALLAACENYCNQLRAWLACDDYAVEKPGILEMEATIKTAIGTANTGTTQNKDAQDSSG